MSNVVSTLGNQSKRSGKDVGYGLGYGFGDCDEIGLDVRVGLWRGVEVGSGTNSIDSIFGSEMSP